MTKPLFSLRSAAPLIGLTLICSMLFINTLRIGFFWDDTYLITDNQYIKSIQNIPLFFTPHYWDNLHPFQASGQYRPVRTATFAVDYFFWQLRPAGYHLTNLLLHTGNVLLVYCLIHFLTGGLNTDDKNSRWLFSLPFLTALLFAAHPVHTESIAFVKNRAELLACFFFLTAFIFFIKISHKKRARSRGLLLSAALLCFGLAVCAKEVALVLPAILVLYAACFLSGAKRRRTILHTLPFWGGILLFVWFRQTVLIITTSPTGITCPSLWQTVLGAAKIMGYYFYLLFFPINLNVEHAFTIPVSLSAPAVFLPAIAVLASLLMILVSHKKNGLLCFGTGWTMLTLLPAVNLIYVATRPIAEQRLYVPSLGICLLLALGIHRVSANGKTLRHRNNLAAISLLAAILVFYSTQTLSRHTKWQRPLSLWQDCVARSPHNPRLRNSLGTAFMQKKQYEKAATCFKRALMLDPNNITAYNNLGVILNKTGRRQEAVEIYKKALALAPDDLDIYVNLGNTLLGQGQPEKARQYFQQVLQRDPEHLEARINMAIALFQANQTDKAIDCCQQALQISPDCDIAMYNLGLIYKQQERFQEALSCMQKALAFRNNKLGAHHPDTRAARVQRDDLKRRLQSRHTQ